MMKEEIKRHGKVMILEGGRNGEKERKEECYGFNSMEEITKKENKRKWK